MTIIVELWSCLERVRHFGGYNTGTAVLTEKSCDVRIGVEKECQ